MAKNIDVLHAQETDADRRRGVLADNALSLDLVSAIAGDRPLTEFDRRLLGEYLSTRGRHYFSDLIYSISHQFYLPEVAEDMWSAILQHKCALSRTIGRNVGIAVATLDYLSNITEDMDSALLVGEAHFKEIIGLSLRDGLTGLFNHAYFYQQLDLEVKRYLRYETPVSLALIDIDDFKSVNDTYGHSEGDRILTEMATSLVCAARASDICCRYGGEEFAVILPYTSVDDVNEIANRMRTEMAERLPDDQYVTVSIGMSGTGKDNYTFQALVEKADAALYNVKETGKNRVLAYQEQYAGI